MKIKRQVFNIFFLASFFLLPVISYFSIQTILVEQKIEKLNSIISTIKHGNISQLTQIYKDNNDYYQNSPTSSLFLKLLDPIKFSANESLARLSLYSPIDEKRNSLLEEKKMNQYVVSLFSNTQFFLTFGVGLFFFSLLYLKKREKEEILKNSNSFEFFKNILFEDFSFDIYAKKLLDQDEKIKNLEDRIYHLNLFKSGPAPTCLIKKNGDVVEANQAFYFWIQEQEKNASAINTDNAQDSNQENELRPQQNKMEDLIQKIVGSMSEDKEINLPYYSVKSEQHFVCSLSNTNEVGLKMLVFYPSMNDEVKEKNLFHRIKLNDLFEETIEDMTSEIQKKQVKVNFENCQEKIFLKNSHDVQGAFSMILKRVINLIDLGLDETPRLEFISERLDAQTNSVEIKIYNVEKFCKLKFDEKEEKVWDFFNTLDHVERRLFPLKGNINLDNFFDQTGIYQYSAIKIEFQDLLYVTNSPFVTQHEIIAI